MLDKIAEKHSALGVFGDSVVVISLPAGTPAIEKTKIMAEIPAGMKVAIRISRFTEKELHQIEEHIFAKKWGPDLKKYSVGFSYDGVKDKVIVHTDAPESVIEALRKSYPSDKLEVRKTCFQQQVGRFHDTASFDAGDSVNNDPGRVG
ncbi:hypothetical protein SMA5143A_8114 [Streptomyces sp. MA5143a]|nr:hypothetical protein SMA5143A_8114 [Streptomyces sp. MA5143a]